MVKTFLTKINKAKFDPPVFDENNLFRPSDEISEVSRAVVVDKDNTSTTTNNTVPSNQYTPDKHQHFSKLGNQSSTTLVKKDKSEFLSDATNLILNISDEILQNRNDSKTKDVVSKQEEEALPDNLLMVQ